MRTINEYKNRFNQLLESQLGNVKPLIMEQETFGVTLVETKVIDNTDNGDNGEGVFGVTIGDSISNIKNYWGGGTSEYSEKGGSGNEIMFNFVKIITGKNDGKNMSVRLNGKDIITIPLSNNSGVDNKSYYVINKIQIKGSAKGNNMITFSIDNTQTNALSINKMYLTYTVS